ncbi:MAG: hypothetical protein ACLQJR_05820 [Stellaceae bacterium]
MSAPAWQLLPHVCRQCFGRLLKRLMPDGAIITRCADCGVETNGSHQSLCACGIDTGVARVKLRCIKNRTPSPEAPAEFVAEEATP